MSDIKKLLADGIINVAQYDTYILFQMEELGRNYLKNKIEALFLEQSEYGKMSEPYSWHDGRISSWRDIKLTILKIDKLLGEQDERERNTEFQYGSAEDRSYTGYI